MTDSSFTENLVRIQRDLGMALSQTDSILEACQHILLAVLEIKGIDCGGVYVMNDADGALHMLVTRGLSDAFIRKSATIPVDSSRMRLIRQGTPVYVHYSELGVELDTEQIEEGLRALAVIPVHDEHRLIAVFNVASHDRDEFEPSTRNALETIAAQMGALMARIRMREALEQSEQRYRELIETLPDIVYMTDMEGRFSALNAIFERLTGWNRGDWLGRSCQELFHAEDLPIAEAGVALIMQGQLVGPHEMRVLTRSGTYRTLEFHSSPHRQAGRIIGIQGVARDVTDRKRTEEEVLKFRAAIEQSVDGVLLLQLDGTVQFVNQGWATMHGYRRDELIGRPYDLCFPPNSGQAQIAAFFDRVRTQGSDVMECDHCRQDGSVFSALMSATLVKADRDTPIGMVVMARDNTVQKRIEASLKDSLREKVVMLKEIHHRVKNNLQVISSLLNLQSVYLRDEKDRALFADSQLRVKSMALVHERLYQSEDLSRIDFHEYVTHLIYDLFSAFNADSCQIRLELDLARMSLGIDQAIPCGLILNELVSNALKHGFKVNEVDRRQHRQGLIRVCLCQDDRQLTVVVSNTGAAFPADVDIYTSTSMGMQLINILTQQLNGALRLDVQNQTMFTLTIPLRLET